MVSPGVAQTPNDLWWAVDLVDGATVDGSTRVVVEVVRDEFGCGDSMRPIDWAQVQPGASVSFEVVADPPDERPPYWYRLGDQTLDSEPALRVRQFRVDCPPGAEEAAATLAENRVLWEQNGPQSYEFTLTIGVFGPWNGRYDVTVTDGGVTSVVRLDEGTDPVMADMPATVDAIFDLLERQVTGDSFTALYHHSLGYPMSVSIDSIAGAVDDEFYVGIDSLTPIG